MTPHEHRAPSGSRWKKYGIHVTILLGIVCADFSSQSMMLAEDHRWAWPFRAGPRMNGHVSPEHAGNFPVQWDEASGKNIRWKIPLEGSGLSTPIVGHGCIWLTAATTDGHRQYLYGINEDSGKVDHHLLIFENPDPEPLGNEINTYASPSCALDGDAVYVHFGTYGTAKIRPESGKVLWQRRDINCRHYRGPGSSPILHDDLLILTFDGIDHQFLTALNRHTGETVWKTDRTTDYGDLDESGGPKRGGDMRKGFSTPGLTEINGRMQLISIGSRAAFGYDAATGKELWKIRHDDFNASAHPAFFKNHAILCTGTRSSNLLSVRLDEATAGDVTDSHVAWDRATGNSDLSAPVLVENRVYLVTSTGVAACIDADTGNEIWKDRVAGTHTASPLVADGHVYFFSEEGDTTIVRASDQFEIVARNHVNGLIRASPAAGHERLYLRTIDHLYCVENRP